MLVLAYSNNYNNDNYGNVYGAISMTSHCESSHSSFNEYRLSAWWLPTLRPSWLTWAVTTTTTTTI